MKENTSKHKTRKTTGSKIIVVPDIITTCPKCGGELGLWSGEKETICIFCHYRMFDRECTIH